MISLLRHPASMGDAATAVRVAVERLTGGYRLQFWIEGEIGRIRRALPSDAPGRRDGLWQTTVCEAFFAGDGEGYHEFNFAPSGDFAAYAFDGYRDGMRDLPAHVTVTPGMGDGVFTLEAVLIADLEPVRRIGPTAIVEEVGGAKSFWAMNHGEGAPDFHHPSCLGMAAADIAGP